MACEFCKNKDQINGSCAYCGAVCCSENALFIYGDSMKGACSCECVLTEKYLIFRNVTWGEQVNDAAAGAAFGVIGILAVGAISAAKKRRYGFYDLKELKKAVYPFYFAGLPKGSAIKFVNKDGSDFVLFFSHGKKENKDDFAQKLRNAGVSIESGEGYESPLCCEKPFVYNLTYSMRVCASAAKFVKMSGKQFAALPIEDTSSSDEPKEANDISEQLYQKNSDNQNNDQQRPVAGEPVVQNSSSAEAVSNSDADIKAWQSAWNMPSGEKSDEESKPEVVEESKPEVVEESKPEVVEESKPEVVEDSKPEVVEESKPEVVEESKPEMVEESKPEVVEESKPEVVEESKPEVVEESKPEVVEESKPEVVEESKFVNRETVGEDSISDADIKAWQSAWNMPSGENSVEESKPEVVEEAKSEAVEEPKNDQNVCCVCGSIISATDNSCKVCSETNNLSQNQAGFSEEEWKRKWQ